MDLCVLGALVVNFSCSFSTVHDIEKIITKEMQSQGAIEFFFGCIRGGLLAGYGQALQYIQGFLQHGFGKVEMSDHAH